nr:immunoglobulin heavy chain junction region [Mus musculus]MBK4195546.1 immunoglobulin heavy chain junction region [Mus musculus]
CARRGWTGFAYW